jgi:hypothetical protein
MQIANEACHQTIDQKYEIRKNSSWF